MATYEQLYQLINATTEEAIGGTAITVKDTTSLVSLGNIVLSSDSNKDEFYGKLADMIGRIVSRYRQIRKVSRGIEVDPLEFGIALQEITVKTIARAKQNNSWGDQVNPFAVLKKDDTDLECYIFKSLGGWEINKVTYDYQLQTAFHNPVELASFMSLIFADAANGMTNAANNNERLCEGTAMALSLWTAAKNGQLTAINLFTAYKAEVDPATELTAATCRQNAGFLRYATEKMLNTVEDAKELSTLYNPAGHETELDDDFKFHMLSEFAHKLSIYLHADTYHEDLLKLPGFSKINSWQGLGSDTTWDEKSKIAIESSPDEEYGISVEQSGIVGHLFASPRMLTVIDRPRTKSIYNPASECTTWFYKADIGYIVRPYEVGIVFYIADTDFNPDAVKVKITNETLTVEAESTLTMTASTVPADGVTVSWSSSDTSAATINSSTGVLTGVAAGTTTVTATATDGETTDTDSVTVTVTAKQLTKKK